MVRELSVSRGGVSIGAAACGSNYRDRRVNLLLSSLVDGGFANVLFGLQHYARSMADLQVQMVHAVLTKCEKQILLVQRYYEITWGCDF